MKFYLWVLEVTAIHLLCNCARVWSHETLTRVPYSVTKFPGIEQVYLQARERNPETPSVDLPLTSKWIICAKIFHQSIIYSEPRTEQLLNPLEYREELRNHYLRTFNDVFDRFQRRLNEYYFEYTNRSKERVIAVNGNPYSEYAFSCLVRSSASRLIKQYYVSLKDYNVNEAQNGTYIVGRFMFSMDAENHVVLHALAEEYALSPEEYLDRMEQLFVAKHVGYLPAQNVADDPICKLDYGRKLRICNALMKMYIWAPLSVTVEEQCERERFLFVESGSMYNEWMLKCKVDGLLRFVWRISRSYTDNEIFVFGTGARGLKMNDYYRNIGVVQDRPTPAPVNNVKIEI